MLHYFIYKITNLLNNKIYIGVHSTSDINDGYMGSGTAIVRAIKKYRVGNFKKEILETFDSYEAALAREKEIVTQDFILREDVYNLRCGGVGGFQHVNAMEVEDRPNIKALRRKIESGEIKVGGTAHWTSDSFIRAKAGANKGQQIRAERVMLPEARKKRKETFEKIQHQVGERNSQFGRIWISNVLTKEVKRITMHDAMPNGWVKGKKGHVVTKCWVNNGITEHYILIENQEGYFTKGFSSGRLKKSMPQNRIVV